MRRAFRQRSEGPFAGLSRVDPFCPGRWVVRIGATRVAARGCKFVSRERWTTHGRQSRRKVSKSIHLQEESLGDGAHVGRKLRKRAWEKSACKNRDLIQPKSDPISGTSQNRARRCRTSGSREALVRRSAEGARGRSHAHGRVVSRCQPPLGRAPSRRDGAGWLQRRQSRPTLSKGPTTKLRV